jgi:hypothetical protein
MRWWRRSRANSRGLFPPDEGKPDANVPHGEFLQGTIADSKIYPGTENGFEVYVPASTIPPGQPASW